ncbi:MAG: 16S rRNA (adenine(1518)-N(6)/adenine(1519)-N(6))-dimethyltransferase RsmA [Negativicutes bacterium]|jgi:16S rRNA (adenine1518-N6/adenine1519-N6)-dimethyltransferase
MINQPTLHRPIIAKREVTRHILRKFDIRASKRLGQNFLVNEDVVNNIVSLAGITAGDNVLEIGPGLGTLTQKLAEAGAHVKAIEIDAKMVKILETTIEGYTNVEVIHNDVLEIDLMQIFAGQPFKVVANLPYYITTPIVMTLLEKKLPITQIVVMMQKEVAERFTATPGGKEYGAVTVAVQYYSLPELLFEVAPQSFIPEPSVTSAVVRLELRAEKPVELVDEEKFFNVIKCAFAQRRKTLANNLKAFGIGVNALENLSRATQIDLNRRGETLSLQEFALLANELSR